MLEKAEVSSFTLLIDASSPLSSFGTKGTIMSECQEGHGRKRELANDLLKELMSR
jgi:hypothetical protein